MPTFLRKNKGIEKKLTFKRTISMISVLHFTANQVILGSYSINFKHQSNDNMMAKEKVSELSSTMALNMCY